MGGSICMDSIVCFDHIMIVLTKLHIFQSIPCEPMHWSWILDMNPNLHELMKKLESINDVFMKLCTIYENKYFIIYVTLRWASMNCERIFSQMITLKSLFKTNQKSERSLLINHSIKSQGWVPQGMV